MLQLLRLLIILFIVLGSVIRKKKPLILLFLNRDFINFAIN